MLWFVVWSCGIYHIFRIITPLVPCWIWCHTNILCQYTKKGEQYKNMCAYQLRQLYLILSAVNLTGWLWFGARNRNLKDEWKKENWVPLDVIWQSYGRRTAYHWHLNWLRKGSQANNFTGNPIYNSASLFTQVVLYVWYITNGKLPNHIFSNKEGLFEHTKQNTNKPCAYLMVHTINHLEYTWMGIDSIHPRHQVTEMTATQSMLTKARNSVPIGMRFISVRLCISERHIQTPGYMEAVHGVIIPLYGKPKKEKKHIYMHSYHV